MQKHHRSTFVRLIAPVAALSLVAGACGDDDDDTTDTTSPAETTETTELIEDVVTITDLAVATPELSTLATALETAELTDVLDSEGSYTVFAPTDEAFTTDMEAIGEPIEDLLADLDRLEEVLLTHVVADNEVMSGDIEDGATLMSMSGAELEFAVSDDGVTVNDVNIETTDLEAANGVVHLIDGILFPD